MKVLILSDIHGNAEALRAVLAAAGRVDAVWNLGDNVGYGASPNQVLDLVRPISSCIVRGNHDRICSGLGSLSQFNPTAGLAAEWTNGALTEDNLQWLRALPTGPVSPMDGVLLTHGSPRHEDHYLLDIEDAEETLNMMENHLGFFGHTHVQGTFMLEGKRVAECAPIRAGHADAESATLQLLPENRYLVNPGSVGQPRDRDWRSAFAIYDTETLTITFHRIPYDIATAQQRILAAGLPPRLAQRLAHGA